MENLPNFNEAHRFARAFDGRVFIATYQALGDEILRWGDRPRDGVGVRNSVDEVRTPWTVSVDQYKMMSWSLAKWASGEIETPDARTLSQHIRTARGTESVQVCRDVFWLHLQRVALVTETVPGRESEHVFRSTVRKVGIDPHFAYANMLADVAFARAYGMSQMLFPSEETPRSEEQRQNSPYRQQIEDALPHLFYRPDPDCNCGNCMRYDPESGRCTETNYRVTPELLSCEAYVPLDSDDEDDLE